MARAKKNVDLQGQADPKTPLDWQAFLSAAAPVMKALKADLSARAKNSAAVTDALVRRHQADKADKRTADSFVEWSEHFVEQVAAAWMLSCVFVRTLEDRGLLGHNRLAGPGAADSFKLFTELAPSLNERDYLLTVFRELQRFPATKGLFDARHNPVWLLTPSAEGAKALVQLFATPRQDVPAFRFGQSDTAFLGWIYQDLDEGVRARFALLQTPRFIESFILDRTLEPAIEKFGLDDTTLIDPTCGSGHFLLGAFERLFERRLVKEPGISQRAAAHRALDAVYGADINAYAVAIARFRLTLGFFDKAGFARLSDAPALPLHVVVADSLMHNPHVQQGHLGDFAPSAKLWKGEEFALEDEAEARSVLFRQFAAVVGNPPYITVKDAVLRERYRSLYPRSAGGKYSIAAPFTERFFQLARAGGRVGMITANSFMKREFGKKLIEQYLPTVNLDGVINTSGAYIPGHGTPTVLLFGSHESARGTELVTVLANRGEPSTPEDAEHGLVWRSIADHWSEPGFENEYISVAKTSRDTLAKHPWSLGGGGAAELKELLEERAEKRLGEIAEDIGFASFTGLDELFIIPASTAATMRIEADLLRPMVTGEDVRDWSASPPSVAITPYSKMDQVALPLDPQTHWARFLWRLRTNAKNVLSFGGKTRFESGQNWWEWYRWQAERYVAPYRITFAFVATHNHFVLDRGGKVFKQSAPIIKLPATATEDDHLALLAYLNSSTACFWMKQVSQVKQMTAHDSVRITELAKVPREFAGTQLQNLVLPPNFSVHRARFISCARQLDELAAQLAALTAENAVEAGITEQLDSVSKRFEEERRSIRNQMVAAQESLDWFVYFTFGLTETEIVANIDQCAPGERAFERLLGRADGATLTIDGFSIPAPDSSIDAVLEPRYLAMRLNSAIRTLEGADFKRRWIGNQGKFNRLVSSLSEEIRDAASARVVSDVERILSKGEQTRTQASAFPDLAPCERGLLGSFAIEFRGLLATESIPFLFAYCYSASGIERKREWQRTWDLQRREDAGEKIASIPVPPKYAQTDYRTTTYWQLRGPLDVPKERFISYPGCESDHDHEPVYGWAGWDHEQRAKALATLYWNRKTEESWGQDRLTPMLAGLLELLPWLHQWHGEASDDYGGDAPATYYAGFLETECLAFGLTHDDLRAWRPPEKTRGRKVAAAAPVGDDAAAPAKPARKPRAKKAKAPALTPTEAGDDA